MHVRVQYECCGTHNYSDWQASEWYRVMNEGDKLSARNSCVALFGDDSTEHRRASVRARYVLPHTAVRGECTSKQHSTRATPELRRLHAGTGVALTQLCAAYWRTRSSTQFRSVASGKKMCDSNLRLTNVFTQ